MTLVERSLIFIAGVWLWTLVEYALHRWVGHLRGGRRAVSREHLQHHATPTYFTPLPRKLLLAVPVIGAIAAIAAWVSSPGAASAFTLGFAAGWAAYERLHQAIHIRAPRNAYGRWARRHHLHHHFARPRMNHGVTTSLWDHVFGTYEAPSVVRIPRRHATAFRWLLDVDAGEPTIKDAHAAHYRIV